MHAARGASRCCSHLSTAGLGRLSVSDSHGIIFFFFFFFFLDAYQLILRPVAKLVCVRLHGPLTVALVLICLCLTRVSVVVVSIHRRVQTACAASNSLFMGGGLGVQYLTVCLTRSERLGHRTAVGTAHAEIKVPLC